MQSSLYRTDRDLASCFETKKILEWDNVERYLNNNNLWQNPDILEMFSNNDVEFRNDSYCKIRRNQIKDNGNLELFDLICMVFDIEHEFYNYKDTTEDVTELIFWISW